MNFDQRNGPRPPTDSAPSWRSTLRTASTRPPISLNERLSPSPLIRQAVPDVIEAPPALHNRSFK
eukprot:1430866-Pyramimonas_sp.AAC.1